MSNKLPPNILQGLNPEALAKVANVQNRVGGIRFEVEGATHADNIAGSAVLAPKAGEQRQQPQQEQSQQDVSLIPKGRNS